jgi:hypothetical protein
MLYKIFLTLLAGGRNFRILYLCVILVQFVKELLVLWVNVIVCQINVMER